jgi:hypothetical protein
MSDHCNTGKREGQILLIVFQNTERIDLLLGKDPETNNETTVAMQWRGKHASTTIELLLETVFSTQSMLRSYIEDN